MNHIFCFNCGKKLEYSLSKPKFCGACGEPIDGKQTQRVKTRKKSEASSDDFTNADEVPQLNGIEVETEQYGGSFTFGSLLGEESKPKFKGQIQYKIDDFTG